MAGLGRVKVEQVPAWAYAGQSPGKYAFFAAMALAGLEDKAIRLDAATQRALLGAPLFGKRAFRVDSKTGTIRVMKSTCFGTDAHTGDYPPAMIQLALNQQREFNPGHGQDAHVPDNLLQQHGPTPNPEPERLAMDMFYLTTLNSPDNASHRTVAAEVEAGDFESFAARFINGLVHQAHAQTGHPRPIGETAATRIANDLFVLVNQVAGVERKFDYPNLHSLLRLDVAPR